MKWTRIHIFISINVKLTLTSSTIIGDFKLRKVFTTSGRLCVVSRPLTYGPLENLKKNFVSKLPTYLLYLKKVWT